MTYYSEGVQTGAAANRRSSPVSSLEVLARMRTSDPTASYKLLLKKWCGYIEARSEYQDAVLKYAFRNYWTQLNKNAKSKKSKAGKGNRSETHPRSETSEQRQERVTQEIGQVVTAVGEIILMNLVLPSGKMLKDSTFAECAKAGGFYSKVAQMGKPNAIVGETTSEAALRSLWLKRAKKAR